MQSITTCASGAAFELTLASSDFSESVDVAMIAGADVDVACEDLKPGSDIVGSVLPNNKGSIGSGLSGAQHTSTTDRGQRSRHWLLKSESHVRQFGLRLLASGFLYFSTAYV